MPNQIMVVTFVIKVQSHGPQFVIPASVCRAFGWKSGSDVGLIIFGQDGRCRFHGKKTMKSGPEIYGIDIGSQIKPDEWITVYAHRLPSKSKVKSKPSRRANKAKR